MERIQNLHLSDTDSKLTDKRRLARDQNVCWSNARNLGVRTRMNRSMKYDRLPSLIKRKEYNCNGNQSKSTTLSGQADTPTLKKVSSLPVTFLLKVTSLGICTSFKNLVVCQDSREDDSGGSDDSWYYRGTTNQTFDGPNKPGDDEGSYKRPKFYCSESSLDDTRLDIPEEDEEVTTNDDEGVTTNDDSTNKSYTSSPTGQVNQETPFSISKSSDMGLIPPEGGYGWVIVFAAFLIHVIVDGVTFTFGILSTDFQDYFEAGSGMTNLVGSVQSGVYLLTAPIASVLINRFGTRIVAICGCLIATFGFGIASISPSMTILLVTYSIIGGVGLGLLYLPAVISVSFYFEKRRAMTTGIVVCGSGVGGFIYAPLFDYLLTTWSWKYCVTIIACITLNGCVAGSLLRPLLPTRKPPPDEQNPARHLPDLPRVKSISDAMFALRYSSLIHSSSLHLHPGSSAVDVSATKNIPSPPNSLKSCPRMIKHDPIHEAEEEEEEKEKQEEEEKRAVGQGTVASRCKTILLGMIKLELWKNPLFVIPCVVNFLAMLGVLVPFYFVKQRALLLPDVDGTQAAFLLSVIAITNTIGRVLVGFLADVKQVSALLLHNAALVTAGLSTILSMFCTSYPLTCIYAAVFGLCFGTWISLTSVILCELLGLQTLTDSFGLLTMVRGIACMIGPPIAGAVYDSTQNYNNPFHVAGAFFLAGGLLSCLLHLPVLQEKKFRKTPQR